MYLILLCVLAAIVCVHGFFVTANGMDGEDTL